MSVWKHFLRLDPKLTEMAKNIFGDDMIDSAYVSIEGSGIASDELDEEMYKKIDEHIDIDYKKIVLKLRNGRMVLIYTSEWGNIEQLFFDRNHFEIA